MQLGELLVEGYGRVRGGVHGVLEGAGGASGPGEEVLTFRPDGEANTVAWLVWHLTRVQDDHLADAAGTEQVWLAGGWQQRFGLPFAADATGYGQTADEVAAVRSDAALLRGYHDAVHERTAGFLAGLTAGDLDRVVDPDWDPPVTLGVRLVSVLSDDLQHLGQAAYVRGLAERR